MLDKKGGGGCKLQTQKATSKNSYGVWKLLNSEHVVYCHQRHMAMAGKHFQALHNKHQCNPQQHSKESTGNIIKCTHMSSAATTVTPIFKKKNWTSRTIRQQVVAMHDMKAYWRGSTDPLILDLSTRWRQSTSWPSCLSCPPPLPSQERAPSTQWTGDWLGPRAITRALDQRKISFPYHKKNHSSWVSQYTG
jgi:hypothetical protein